MQSEYPLAQIEIVQRGIKGMRAFGGTLGITFADSRSMKYLRDNFLMTVMAGESTYLKEVRPVDLLFQIPRPRDTDRILIMDCGIELPRGQKGFGVFRIPNTEFTFTREFDIF